MKLSYLNHSTLDMLYRAQKSIERDYIYGRNITKDAIYEQTLLYLKDYVKGTSFVELKDLPILVKMARSLVLSSNRKDYEDNLQLYYQINASALQRYEIQEKMKDVNAVAYLYNNKNQDKFFEPENIITARQTLLADTTCPEHIKNKTLQQIENCALLSYAQSQKEKFEKIDAYEKMADMFQLKQKDMPDNVAEFKPNVISEQYVKQAVSSAPKIKKKESKFMQFTKKIKAAVINVYRGGIKRFEKFGDKHSSKIVIGVIAASSIMGLKLFNDNQNKTLSENTEAKTTKIIPQSQEQNKGKTADFAQEAKKIESQNKLQTQPKNQVQEKRQEQNKIQTTQQKTQSQVKTVVGKDYYDTSLMIHLGSKSAVQSLYNKIDSLIENKKIKKLENLDTKRYAHSFTMYNLIRPNSAENKAIQNLLSGGKENPDMINHLVLKAKAKGSGVKADNHASQQKSNFDNASQTLQIQHLKNLQGQR